MDVTCAIVRDVSLHVGQMHGSGLLDGGIRYVQRLMHRLCVLKVRFGIAAC